MSVEHDGPRIVIGRFHDGSATPNWGGRATSLAMAGLISNSAHVGTITPLNGTFNTEPFEQGSVPASPHDEDPHRLRLRTLKETARAIVESPRNELQQHVVQTLSRADELWMNGEGDLILTRQRLTLARTLLITEIAFELGIRVRIVNSILSEAPGVDRVHPMLIRALGSVLERSESVLYRDPQSLELHRTLFPDVTATWAPDALFDWAELPTGEATSSGVFGAAREGLSIDAARFLEDPSPYVVVSGASGPRAGDEERIDQLRDFVSRLADRGLRTLLVATDRPDAWLEDGSDLPGTAFVPADVPLSTGRALLSGARAFVSGRYHPSILAFGAGTPCVLMRSNSHKTQSLQRVMGLPIEEHPAFGLADLDVLVERTTKAARSSARARRALRRRALGNATQVRSAYADLGAAARA